MNLLWRGTVWDLFPFCSLARNVIEAKKNLLNQFEWDLALISFKPFFFNAFNITLPPLFALRFSHLLFARNISFYLHCVPRNRQRTVDFVTYLLHLFRDENLCGMIRIINQEFCRRGWADWWCREYRQLWRHLSASLEFLRIFVQLDTLQRKPNDTLSL